MHGIQAWVGAADRGRGDRRRPSSITGRDDLPTYESGGLWARLIAGEAFGAQGQGARPIRRCSTSTGGWRPGAKAQLPAEYPERAAFVVAGEVEVDGQRFGAGQMLVFAPGRAGAVHRRRAPRSSCCWAASRSARASSSGTSSPRRKERIDQAKADWRAGRMKLPDFDNQEFIPLPPDPHRPAPPL